MKLLLDSENAVVGTFVREANGACLLRYSSRLWSDPPSALNAWPEEFCRAIYDLDNPEHLPQEAVALKPGEFLRFHGALEARPLGLA